MIPRIDDLYPDGLGPGECATEHVAADVQSIDAITRTVPAAIVAGARDGLWSLAVDRRLIDTADANVFRADPYVHWVATRPAAVA